MLKTFLSLGNSSKLHLLGSSVSNRDFECIERQHQTGPEKWLPEFSLDVDKIRILIDKYRGTFSVGSNLLIVDLDV